MEWNNISMLEFAIIIMSLVGGVLWLFKRIRSKRTSRSAWQPKYVSKIEHRQSGTYPDAADQLRMVMSAKFSPQQVLNDGEARLFRELDRMVQQVNPSWKVIAQVSLGEILTCRDYKAFLCINSKRVDLLIMDGKCKPRHAVEYQGQGHHKGTAAARDAVKKEALRRAGIGYYEVVVGETTPSDIRQLVERIVEKSEEQVNGNN